MQLRVAAIDGGAPARTSTTMFTIDVQRNLLDPVFVESQVQVSIPETLAPGSHIANVTATDDDVAVREILPCVLRSFHVSVMISRF